MISERCPFLRADDFAVFSKQQKLRKATAGWAENSHLGCFGDRASSLVIAGKMPRQARCPLSETGWKPILRGGCPATSMGLNRPPPRSRPPRQARQTPKPAPPGVSRAVGGGLESPGRGVFGAKI